jgi:hypothetical protein
MASRSEYRKAIEETAEGKVAKTVKDQSGARRRLRHLLRSAAADMDRAARLIRSANRMLKAIDVLYANNPRLKKVFDNALSEAYVDLQGAIARMKTRP